MFNLNRLYIGDYKKVKGVLAMNENVFKNKNFVLTFFGALVSNIGAALYTFAVSFYILTLSNNNALLQGIYLGVCGLIFVLMSPIAGVLVDRWHKGKTMYLCDYIKGLVILLSGISFIFFKDALFQIVMLFVLGVISNITAAFFSPASSALLPIVLKDNQLQQANSYFSVLTSFENILGVVLAGILYSLLDINTLFIIIGSLYLLSAVSEMFIKYTATKDDNSLTIKVFFNDLKDGVKYLYSFKPLLLLIASATLLNFFFSPIFDNFLAYFIETKLTVNSYMLDELISPEMWSAIYSVIFCVSSLVSSIILSTRKQKDKIAKPVKIGLLILSIVLLTSAVLYFVLIDKYLQINAFLISLMIILSLVGLTLPFVNIPITTKIQVVTEEKMLGKVLSLTSMISQGLVPISAFLAGIVITYLGSFALLLICSLGFIVTTLILFINKSAKEI